MPDVKGERRRQLAAEPRLVLRGRYGMGAVCFPVQLTLVVVYIEDRVDGQVGEEMRGEQEPFLLPHDLRDDVVRSVVVARRHRPCERKRKKEEDT